MKNWNIILIIAIIYLIFDAVYQESLFNINESFTI